MLALIWRSTSRSMDAILLRTALRSFFFNAPFRHYPPRRLKNFAMLDFYSGLRRPVTMQNTSALPGADQLKEYGLRNVEVVHWNLGTAQLVERALQMREGVLASGGALV